MPSRSELLKNGAALAVFSPALVTSMIKAAEAATPADIELLNRALEDENAGIKAYEDAATLNLLSPAVLTMVKGFVSDHRAHAAALTAAVKAAGGKPSTTTPKLQYPSLRSQADIIAFAEKLELGAASLYVSEIGRLSNPQFSKLLASILGVETTHVSMLASALKQDRAYVGFIT